MEGIETSLVGRFGLRFKEACDLLTTRHRGQRPDSALHWHLASLRFQEKKI